MTLPELKTKILNNKLDFDVLIFRYEDNCFLVNSYISAIAKNKKLTITQIDSLRDVSENESDMFGFEDNSLYVLSTDKLEDDVTKYNLHNVIIKTKDITDEKSSSLAIKFDKLVNWQIEDYVKVLLPGLKDEQIQWLCDITNYDIYRLDLECKKINIFDKSQQQCIFNELNNDNMYEDLNNLTIFNFTNALIRKNPYEAKKVLDDIKNIDVEPTGVVTILYKNFKNLLNIQTNPKCTPESLGLSPKQFAAIKRNCNIYSNDKVKNIYKMISDIDYQLKSGILDNSNIVDYIVTRML